MSDLLAKYQAFLRLKVAAAPVFGFTPKSEPHPCLKPHQRDIARWMVHGGRRANFSAFGLGKTRTHLQVAKWVVEHDEIDPDRFPQHVPRKFLIVAPLGCRKDPFAEEAPAMDMQLTYVRTDAEVDAAPTSVVITNYERVRDGGITITPERFCGAGLDEASVLRSYGSKTYQSFLKMFADIPYRFVFTATPSPNRHKELIHYAGYLGVMDTGQALTRFFHRDSSKAGNLTLYPHMEERFWEWLATWAVFMQKPSDLGYSDEGYDLPPIEVHWHCVPVDHKKAWNQMDSWGQRQLFLDKSSGLRDLAEVKRETIVNRLACALDIIADKPEAHWLLWHDLEAERYLIERLSPMFGIRTAFGSQDLEEREETILGFSRGEYAILATKPVIAGSGCNFQRHCADAVFLGSSYKFNDFIQAVHRIQRFQQPNVVHIHVIYSESEDPVIAALKRKWAQHDELVLKMSTLLKTFKLDLETMQITRTIGTERTEVSGERFRLVNNDSVPELDEADGHCDGHCVDLIVTSIPFGNQYEYSPSYNDFGHNPDNGAFFDQMDFLVPNLLRVLKPGRLACIHAKDRIRFGGVTGKGVPTVDRFSDKTADCFEKHGFNFLGRITIDTDVVRENAQTYRLGWTENSKDSTKMGVGMPEYVLLFRKPQSDTSKAYADVPVVKDKSKYMRAHWQVDAASFWKSNGNRLPDPELLLNMSMDGIGRLWREHARNHGYDWTEHVEVAAALEKLGKLPASFMLFPPISNHPGIWTDIARMRVLNSEQDRRNQEHHVCPLQLDIANRLIERYSNPGEIVLDPFAGIGTVPVCAIQLGRIGYGIELSHDYWTCAVGYCEQAERERTMPTLFDLVEKGAVEIGS